MAEKHSDNAPQRTLWNKWVPVSVRHNFTLLAGSLIGIILVALFVGSTQIRPLVFSKNTVLDNMDVTSNVAGSVDFFDRSIPHSMDLRISAAAYQLLIRDFQSGEGKTWVQADVSIDGISIDAVGLRLKGNSTLMSLKNAASGNSEAPSIMTDSFATASFDNPSSLPLLISFDRFIPGRLFQGRSELALRPVTADNTNLNEALALQLIADSGQVSQNFSWVALSVNGHPSTTRLVIENPDQQYAYRLNLGSGVLYKSTSDNEFRYKGEDITRYLNDFDQLNAVGSMDMTPIIKLLGWLENADADEFDAGLPERVDIGSFASYVVTQELLGNLDDMAGPSRNFMLWYGLENNKFSVLNWDMNLALGAADLAGMTYSQGVLPVENLLYTSSAFPESGGVFGNQLKERFVASAAFADEIARQRENLSGLWDATHANALIDQLHPSIAVSDTLSKEQIAASAERLKQVVFSMLR